jgi:FkbM family methyltransferase
VNLSFKGATRHVKRAAYWLILRESTWSRQLAALSNVYPSSVEYDRRSKALRMKDFDLSLRPGVDAYFLDAFGSAALLKDEAGARFSLENGAICCRMRGLTFRLHAACDLDTLREIFVDGAYNVVARGAHVVLDIGMNVGAASLFFANASDSIVYGFEPFAETYRRALENIALNPQVAGRIVPANVGLGERDAYLEVPYSENFSTACTTAATAGLAELGPDARLERVRVRDVRGVLAEIRGKHPGAPLLVKMDCEGEEFAIFDALRDGGWLPQIDAMMVEWHGARGPGEILSALSQGGFVSFSFKPSGAPRGMIYAVRLGSQSAGRSERGELFAAHG